MFSCELCEISQNTFFTEYLRVTPGDCFCIFRFRFYRVHGKTLIDTYEGHVNKVLKLVQISSILVVGGLRNSFLTEPFSKVVEDLRIIMK